MHLDSPQIIRQILEEKFKIIPRYLKKELPKPNVEGATRVLCP